MHSAGIQAFHWRLLRWFVRGVAASVQRTLQISVAEEPASAAAAAKLRGEEPVLVLSRHAGPADTILLIDRLLSHFDRRPSVVLKDAVALEPAVDLISHRLPHAVLDPDDPEGCRERITATAAALGGRGALLLFPEGGNFTPERRRRALASLRRHRRFDSVHAGERMPHVLPPRPAGTVAALHGSPETDVIFLAHTGLGLAAYPLEIWRRLPVGQTLTTRMWLVPRAEIPTGEDEIAGWLTNWWRRIDSWIDGHGEEEVH
jgi:1-acyl-sn-glycerol-3-phosphate acyltransferase